MLLIKIGASHIVGFGRLDGNVLRHLFIDARIQRLSGEEFLKRHVGIGGGYGSTPAREIQVRSEGHDEKTEDQSGKKFHS